MDKRERVFTHPSQLNSLSALPFLRTGGIGTLRLGGGLSEHPDRVRWERDLNRFYYDCGCDWGAKGLIVALVGGAAWAGLSFSKGSLAGTVAVGVALASGVAGAIVGKLLGRIRADARLKQGIREIQGQWRVAEKPEKEHWICG